VITTLISEMGDEWVMSNQYKKTLSRIMPTVV